MNQNPEYKRKVIAMDTKQLKWLLEIEKCGSISKAAKNLYISQSGLNQQLLHIERELGIIIFDRTTHSLQLTESGRIVISYAQDALYRESRMYDLLNDVSQGNTGTINLNLAMEQGIELFSLIFPIFHKKYPYVDLRLHDFIVSEQYRMLHEKSLDIGMVMVKHKNAPGIEYIHLRNERFLLGVPQMHPLSRNYRLSENQDYPEIDLSICQKELFSLMFSGSTFREVVDPLFLNAGFSPKILFESRTNNVIAQMVNHGLCLTILPESQAKLYPNICWFKLNGSPSWESCLIYSRNRPPRKAGRYLIDLAVEQAKNIHISR